MKNEQYDMHTKGYLIFRISGFLCIDHDIPGSAKNVPKVDATQLRGREVISMKYIYSADDTICTRSWKMRRFGTNNL